MTMILVLVFVILLVLADLAARETFRRFQERKRRAECEAALAVSLRLDFTRESKTLKRVEVTHPEARILCVDDEAVILDSFRKILVLDGYSVDTVETGQEALGLIQAHHYDFVFTDLKMPAMAGTDVAKSVKHIRPDMDVVIITGFATVESAVECMKHGAMDYLQKPFTEDELRAFVKNALIRRRNRIAQQLKPKVKIMGSGGVAQDSGREFSIPGGVLISDGHCWASLAEDGAVKVGLDDFAKKLLGHIDGIDFPNVGMEVKIGQPLFTVRQGQRRAPFYAPLSGRVVRINSALREDCATLEEGAYDKSWICVIDGDHLDEELRALKIGKSAIVFYQEDIDRFRKFVRQGNERSGVEVPEDTALCLGAIEKLDDARWETAVKEFFGR